LAEALPPCEDACGYSPVACEGPPFPPFAVPPLPPVAVDVWVTVDVLVCRHWSLPPPVVGYVAGPAYFAAPPESWLHAAVVLDHAVAFAGNAESAAITTARATALNLGCID
jgi:hypothetical protein